MLNQLPSFFQLLKKRGVSTMHLELLLLCLSLSGCHLNHLYSLGESTGVARQRAADHHLELGLAYLELGHPRVAREKLFEAERQNPNDFRIKMTLAYVLETMGERKKANTYYLNALHINKKDGALHNNYGRFLCECGQYEKADSHFLEAFKDVNYSNMGIAYENAGLCAMRQADTKKAIGYLKEALEHDSCLEKSWLALSQLHRDHQPLLAYQYLEQYQRIASHPRPIAIELNHYLREVLYKPPSTDA